MAAPATTAFALPKVRTFWILVACALAGCSGGGAGNSSTGALLPVVATSPPAPATFVIAGTVNITGPACDGIAANCSPIGAATGFSVVLGGMPSAGNGGSPVAPLYAATTDSSGHFSLAAVPTGTYEIQIGKDSTFATLHAKVVAPTAGLAYSVSALTGPTGTISGPNYNPALALVSGSSNGTPVTVAITYVNSRGESSVSNCQNTVTPTTAQQVQVLSPPNSYDATGYNVYVVDPSGHNFCFTSYSRQNSSPIPLGTPFTIPGTPVLNGIGPPGTGSAMATLGEQGWFVTINRDRAQRGAAPIVSDEYAMEAGRAYAEYLEANSMTVCNPTCVNYPQFGQQYQSAGGLFSYGDSYRVALSEGNCPSFAEQDSNQGTMLAASSARFGGYGYRGTAGGSCAFALVGN